MKKLLMFSLFFFVNTVLFSQTVTFKYSEDRFEALYKTVSKHYKKDELKQLLEKSEVKEIDPATDKNLRFILNPRSVKQQASKHEDYIAKLVNDETIRKGVIFFAKYYAAFEQVYKNTKVHPADIIAILNWESKLGEMTGDQQIIKIFIGQYFFAENYNEILKKEGAYEKEGAMTFEQADKRIERLKKNALGNLTALLTQAKLKNFDPATVKGSWAGAIGYPQFMPASMCFATDGNNDGKIDLFTMEDAIASVANYLKENGYHSKGREHSFKRYNPDRIYAKGVKMYGDMARKAGVEPGKCPPSGAACPIDL
ncbi:MAG TPA: lytic murein transglycosylase [bacterium]|nr:lytic murein transglycosylase [bacterium]